MKYNTTKLHNELKTAALDIEGVDENGRIDWIVEPTDAEKAQAAIILKAHKTTWYVEQRAKEYPTIPEQLDMIYHDQVDGTTKWRDEITRIKNKYPKE